MSKQLNKKGTTMAEKQEMAVREKKELTAKEEKTVPGRHFVPYADIYETDDALSVVLEMPGVEKRISTCARERRPAVDGRIDFSKYKDMEPVYAEYNVGHYGRSFALSGTIDQEKIGANLEDGVLTLTLPKQARPAAQDRDRVRRGLNVVAGFRREYCTWPRPPFSIAGAFRRSG